MPEENQERPMIQGNWTCAECSAPITQLPFEPRAGSDLYCLNCYKAKRSQSTSQREPVKGDWSCADCKASITELPFQPREGTEVRCRECYAKSRS